MSSDQIKRHALILGKEIKDLTHSKALELASRLNGFKNWHEAKQHEEEPLITMPSSFPPFGKTIDIHHYRKTVDLKKPIKGNSIFDVKVVMLTEARVFIQVEAQTKEEALVKAREELDGGIEHGRLEVCYQFSGTDKITQVTKMTDTEDYLENNEVGLEKDPVIWPGNFN